MDEAFDTMDAILDPGPLDLPFGSGVSNIDQVGTQSLPGLAAFYGSPMNIYPPASKRLASRVEHAYPTGVRLQGDQELLEKQRRCLGMEEDLLTAVRRIPAEPKTAWDFFFMQRVQEITNAAQSSGEYIAEDNIRQQVADEFTAVPDSHRQALDQKGIQDLNTHMESVITTMHQVCLAPVVFMCHRGRYMCC